MKELIQIFLVFAKIGVLTFGGGYTMLPLFQKDLADKLKWVTKEEIVDYYAMAQCLPGMIAVNTAMFAGQKKSGKKGMVAAALGMIFPSIVIVLIIAVFLNFLFQFPAVMNAFNGIKIAVFALIANTVYNMWKPSIKDKKGILIYLITLVLIFALNVSPPFIVVAAALAGLLIRRRGAK